MDTIYRLMRLNRLIKSYRLKFLAVYICDLLDIRHLFIRLDPVNACNLKCSMCYWSEESYGKKVRGRFNKDEIKRISEQFLSRCLQLVIGCASEPTLYKNYIELVESAKETYKIPFVGFTTNGQLLSEEAIEKFVTSGLDELTISVHGVTKDTYESFMVNASYEKLLTVLTSLKRIRTRHGAANPQLRINYTINKSNLAELRSFFDVYGDFGIHTLQLRPMVDVGETKYLYREFSENELEQYHQILDEIQEECKRRNIVLLATRSDANFKKEEKSVGYALPAVLRTIHPNKVWAIDFDWRNESYREYCRRIGWRRTLLKSALMDEEIFKKSNLHLRYDVLM